MNKKLLLNRTGKLFLLIGIIFAVYGVGQANSGTLLLSNDFECANKCSVEVIVDDVSRWPLSRNSFIHENSDLGSGHTFFWATTCKWNSDIEIKLPISIYARIPGSYNQESGRCKAIEASLEYCKKQQSMYQKCLNRCLPLLYVNNQKISNYSSLESVIIDNLSGDQAINSLIKKIGTETVLKRYDPNKIYQ